MSRLLQVMGLAAFLLAYAAPARADDGGWTSYECPNSNLVNMAVDLKYDVRVGSDWKHSTFNGGGGQWLATRKIAASMYFLGPSLFIECRYLAQAGITYVLTKVIPKGNEVGECLMTIPQQSIKCFMQGANTWGPRDVACLIARKNGERPDTKQYAYARDTLNCPIDNETTVSGKSCTFRCRP